MEDTTSSGKDFLARLTASDFVIYSTSVHMKNKSLGVWAAPASSKSDVCARKKLTISVKKLREVTPLSRPECSASVNEDAAYIPSVLLANKTVHQKSRPVSSGNTAEGIFNIVLNFLKLSNLHVIYMKTSNIKL